MLQMSFRPRLHHSVAAFLSRLSFVIGPAQYLLTPQSFLSIPLLYTSGIYCERHVLNSFEEILEFLVNGMRG